MPEINIGGYVPQRTPFKRNIVAFTQALDKIDEKAKEALQQQNQIQVALANLDINPAESGWQAAYARNIQNQIDEAATYGDYSRSLNTARMLAGQVASDPSVLGRVKAQAAYKQFTDNLDKRTDITQDVKDWAKSQNPYHYEDKFDDEGHIIAGGNWEANKTPVSTVPISSLLDKAKQWTAVHKGAGVSDIKFVDENGNLTSDPTKNFYGMAYKKSGSWEYLSEKDLRDAFKSALDTTPGARDSIQQDYDVALWKYNKMSDEEKLNNINSDITDDRGLILTPQEYLEKKIKPGLHAMSYSNSSSDIEVGNGQSQFAAARAAGGVGGSNDNLLNFSDKDVEQSVPIEQSVTDAAASNYRNLTNLITGTNGATLRNLFPNLYKSKQFSDLVSCRNYKGLADLLSKNVTSPNADIRKEAYKQIRRLRDMGATYNGYVSGLSQEQREAVDFNLAREAGTRLPFNNRFTRQYNKRINDLFGDNPNKVLGYKTVTEDEFNTIKQRLGIVDNDDWRKKGFTISEINGDKIINFDKNNKYLSELVDGANSALGISTSLHSVFSSHGLMQQNKNGSYQSLGQVAKAHFNALSASNIGSEVPAAVAKRISDNVNAAKGTLNTINTAAVFSESFMQMQNKLDLERGIIDKETYQLNKERIEKQEDVAYFEEGLINHDIYTRNDNTGTLKKQSEIDKQDVINEILQAKGQNRVKVTQMVDPINGQFGAYYTIYPGDSDKKQNIRTVFISGVGNTEAARNYMNDTHNQARAQLKQLQALKGQITTPFGTISNITNEGAILNRNGVKQVISFDDANKIVTIDRNRQGIADRLGTLDRQQLINALTNSLQDQGYTAAQIKANPALVQHEYDIIKKEY